jgi:hypothetical protein
MLSPLSEIDYQVLNKYQKLLCDDVFNIISKLPPHIINIETSYIILVKNKSIVEAHFEPFGNGTNVDCCLYKELFIITIDGWREIDDYDNDKHRNIYSRIMKNYFENNLKVVKYISNDIPYKWEVFERVDDNWIIRAKQGALIYNYFGRKKREVKYFHRKLRGHNT